MSFPWYLENRGVSLEIDPCHIFSDEFTIAVDCETDEKDNLVCIGVCGAPKGEKPIVGVFFDIEKGLNFLGGHQLVMHNGKSDIGWLEKYGFTMDNLYWDTMVAGYVLDSSRKRYALKVLAKEDLNVEWPTYPQITEGKEYIRYSCERDNSLFTERVKHYKRKPSVATQIPPKKLTLEKMAKDVVANYNGTDVWATWRLYQKQKQAATKAQIDYMMKLEFPTTRLVYEMEKTGIRVNLKETLLVHKEYRKKANKAKKVFLGLVGPDCNIGSPSQVLPKLQGKGIRVKDTNYDTIKGFKDTSPMVAALLDYREASKVCQTYTRPIYKLALKSPDQRIHPRFNQTGTITGRFSSSDPNIQNQPVVMKHCYEAKPGCILGLFDYSQMELRAPAHFSGDDVLCAGFLNPTIKFHQSTANALGITYHQAKTVNFLITNGGGGARLAEMAEGGMTEAEGDAIITKYWLKHHKFRDWKALTIALGRRTGTVTTLFGRTTRIPDINHRSYWIRGEAERTLISVKVQGSAAEIAKAAALKVWHLYDLVPLVNEHDALLYELPEAEYTEWSEKIKYEMENVVKLRVPLVVEPTFHKTWGGAKEQ